MIEYSGGTGSPKRALLRQADGGPGDALDRGGRPGRRVLVSYFHAVSRRCRARSVAGCHREDPGPLPPRDEPASAANQARSAGSYRIRPAFRRNTAFSCRSTSNSASFARSPRKTSATRPNSQRLRRYEIFRSTRTANQHHTRPGPRQKQQVKPTIEYSGGTGWGACHSPGAAIGAAISRRPLRPSGRFVFRTAGADGPRLPPSGPDGS